MSDHLILVTIAGSAALLLFLYKLYTLWTGPLSRIPGPGITKYTNLLNRRHQMKGTRLYWLRKLHERYGPIVRVGPKDVSVADTEATREIYKTAGGYLKTDFYTKFEMWEVPSMFTARDSDVHAKMRRLFAQTMSESNIKILQSTVQEKVKLLVSQMQKEHQADGVVDVYKWAHFFSTDVIGEMAFSGSFETLETGKVSQYMKDLHRSVKLNLLRALIFSRPLYHLPRLPIWPLSEAFALRDRLHQYATQSIQRYIRHRQEKPDEQRPMFFSHLMGEKGRAAGLTLHEMTVTAQGFLVAGTDTTAVSLTTLIWLLSRHAEAKAKFLAAIASLPGVPTNDELKAIPYIECVLNEALRLGGAVLTPLPRSVPHGGRELGGHFIPEGMIASPVAYVLHRDAEIFPDPDSFKPERWENPTEAMKHSFFPFGGGSRICIGLHLAKMELRMAAVAFFRAFPNAEPALGVNSFSEDDMYMLDYFISRPKGGRCLMR